jgi:capsular exopolysaccharide synthesis family protein
LKGFSLDIKDYLRIFRRYWWVVVLTALIGAGVGFATTRLMTPEYQSTARLFVATQHGTSVTDAYQNNLFSQERVISYAGIATSEQVAMRAVDQLKAPISPSDLREKITAKPEEKTVLLDVSVTDPDPAQAQVYANAVSDQLVGLVSELETSRRGGSPAAGLVLVDEANYPTEPVGMSPLMQTALGAAGGFVAGIILAVLIGIVDKRLRRRESVEDITGARILGVLPRDPSRPKVDSLDLAGDGLYAERIRELRTNLRFARPDGVEAPLRQIAITSPSARDGRTTAAIDLATALAESGQSVVLVDGDLRNPALNDRLSLDGPDRDRANARGLSTVLVGEHDVFEVLIPAVTVGSHSIAFLPAGPKAPRSGELWASDRAEKLLDELANEYDYAIIDTSPLNAYTDGAIVGALSDGAVVLARIRHTTSSALRRALETLRAANVTQIGAVVTFEPGHRRALRRDRAHSERASRQRSDRAPAPNDASRVGAHAQDDAATAVIPDHVVVEAGGSPPSGRRRRG